jgi:hypothetical protein
MRLYFDLDKRQLVGKAGYPGKLDLLEFKRGDATTIELVFVRGTVRELLGGTNEIRFAIKELGKYDADPVVFLDAWVEGADSYTGSPNFNTIEINALLANDGDDSNDIAYVNAMLEITFTRDNGATWTSSNTITARINNDVVRGDEGVPVAGAPAYPTAEKVLGIVGVPIADKATAYALTGVAVGTVYKTTDTGQILEYRGQLAASSFTISDAGSPEDASANSLAGDYVYNPTFDSFDHANGFMNVQYSGGRWKVQWTGTAYFQSALCASTVHPADATVWEIQNAATGSIADGTGVTITEPRNWKHDGVILVTDNDEKQLLTNLPDTQQVEVVGEGGRLERYNGDGQGLNSGDFKILVNHPDNPVISSMAINGIYTFTTNGYYENAAGIILGDWGDGTYVFYTGSIEWQSSTALSATPDLVSTWTAVSTAAQAYAPMTSDMVTRLPAANESNWSAIKNTVELVVRDSGSNGTLFVNSVSVGVGATVNVGWVPVGGSIPIDANAAYTDWNVEKVNASAVSSGTAHMLVTDADPLIMVIPDALPLGALVQIKNS